jgi:ATP-dependent Clp protease ATP-binding subunit ClpC
VFERFDDEARRAMIAAQQITRGVGHEDIGTAELLVALAIETFASGRLLVRLGTSRDAVIEAVSAFVSIGSVADLTHRPMANDTKKAILLTGKEADRLGSATIGTEHLLLGVLRERKGVGAKSLKQLGITYDAAREEVAGERSAS